MKFVSTRGAAPALDLADVTLAGLARDGGLYVPAEWPVFSSAQITAMAGLSYADLAVEVMMPFVGDTIARDDFSGLVRSAYASFDHRAVTPLRQSGPDEWVLELFHGPTLAFKDCALQLLGPLFDHLLQRDGSRVTIVGATSGDTGSAAIEACRDRDALDIFILYPHGRVSEIQRRQMTTVESTNVHCLAVAGTFDDCQALVKAMFDDTAFRDRHRLSAVNSINWTRIMAQVVYYFHAALALGAPGRAVAFSVPTGNFGDIFAGYVAAKMGLPIASLCIATNRNDILARFMADGVYQVHEVMPTVSPSMDIQVSSNFERLLFDLMGRDGAAVTALMSDLRTSGRFSVSENVLTQARGLFSTGTVGEEETLAVIAQEWRETGVLVDPHTAVGIGAGRRHRQDGVPLVHLATAHPAKFPEAVERATGVRPALPARLADLTTRAERFDVLANDLGAVEAYVSDRARAA
ncbi:MAG: threonine synthase [Proteobacteria bacterium]|nr:threonine synthase [Pseudomonadota bacterium]MDA1059647.1 threonine synthase [Pseudomonadota bacterium]